MKYILSILITLFAVQAIAQPTPTYTGSYTQMSYNRGSVGALRLQYIPRGFYPFPTFDTLGTIWVDSAMTRGLFYHNGTVRLRLASVPYVDSVAASIEAGSVDSSIYSTVTRLADSLHNLRDYVDSNNTIIYAEIDTANLRITDAFDEIWQLQLDFTNLNNSVYQLDSSVDVAFGAISSLYDTLPNYVPYTGATTDVDLGTHSISARTGVINKPSGSGIALSVTKGGNGEALTVTKTSGAGNAMSVSGGVTQLSELNTTTKIADAYIASALNWNDKYDATDTGRGTTNIVTGGSLNKVRDSLAALSGGGGGGSPTTATNPQILYKSGTDTLKGATNVIIDSTDGRLVFPYNNDTSQVLTSYTGGNKVYTRNTNGRASVMVIDTSAIPYALQGALNAQQYSTVVPNVSAVGFFRDGLFFNSSNSTVLVGTGTYSLTTATYNASNTQSNYARGVYPTAAGAGSIAGLRTGSLAQPPGIICPTTKYGRGGGKGTFMFSLPTYASTQFFYYGYHDNIGVLYTTPSTFFNGSNSVGIGKDITDATLQFMWSSSFPTGVQKVSTGITPNSEDVYRITVYISPKPEYYLQLEVINNNAPTVVRIYKVGFTDANKPIAPKLMFAYFIGNGVTAGAVSYGLIKLTEEIY